MIITQLSKLQSVGHFKTRDGRWLVWYRLERVAAILLEVMEVEWATHRKCRA